MINDRVVFVAGDTKYILFCCDTALSVFFRDIPLALVQSYDCLSGVEIIHEYIV